MEKVMRNEIKNIDSVKELLSAYSGRRLQYAIKLGIMPRPESLKKLLKRKTSTENGMSNRAMA
jgi:hypothetical protein